MSRQNGFTLIETVIVLVIAGLLMGGFLKGQELITSARVVDVIAQQQQVHAAYLAFFDRFRALPGDYRSAVATIPGITGCGGNGNGDGRIDGPNSTPPSQESELAWEHLSKGGFIAGRYTCGSTDPSAVSPINPFGLRLELVWDGHYSDTNIPTNPPPRHNLKTGNQVPSSILAEVDRKIDDGNATSGSFRFSDYTGVAGVPTPDPLRCHNQTGRREWNSSNPEGNCGAASLL